MTFKVKDGISVAGSTFVDGSRNTTTNDLTVGGNLTVSGTTTTINTATLEVADLNITVAKNATTAAAANGAGLTVAGASATLLYTSAADSWNFNKNVFASNLSGTNTGDNPGVTSVAAVTPIVSSGGTTPSISHATSGVGAGTYNNVTVNTFGHVTAGSNTAYLTTLTDTLATVTGRGATTTTAVILNGGLSTGSASTGVTRAVVDTNGNFLSYYAAETTARIQLGRDVGISGGAGLALGGALYALIASSDTNGSALYFKLNTAAATASTSPNMSLTSTGLSVAGTLTASNLSGTNTGDNPGVTSVAGVTPIVSSGGTTPSISHATSGVGAGTYNNVTVNTFGHVTAGSNVGYISGYTEVDTLATVTARGASTSTAVTLSSGANHYMGHFYYDPYDAAGNHYPHFTDGGSASGVKINWRLYAGANNTVTHTWTTSLATFATNIAATNFSGSSSGTNTGDNAGVTSVAAVTPIVSSGGTTPSISHATSGATAGTYNNVTVNTFGHVTAGSNTAYLTAESDTLATVTARGNTTTTSIQASNLNPAYSVSNFDTIKAPGLYQYDGAMTSTPNSDANYRTIEIGSNGRYSQIALNYSSDGMWFRRQTDANWSTWRQVWHSGNLTNLNQLTNGPGYGTGTVTAVTATTPIISSGGTTPNITHATSGATAGTYNTVTVNTFGHVTAGSNAGYVTSSGVTSVATSGGYGGLTLTGGTITTTGTITMGGTPTGTWPISVSGSSASVVATVAGTSSIELVRGNMGDNDQFRILVGATASNAGYVEIATADDGNEPIYVRQYTGVFGTLTRTATLLNESGNTSFPGTLTATNFSGSSSGTNTGDNPGVTSVAGVTPIVSSGGTTPSISHATSGATAGTYNNVTVNTFGHVTAGSNAAYLTDAMRDRGNTTTATVDTATLSGFYNQQNTGDSHSLLVINPGGSTAIVQQRFHYTGSMEFRNKTDSANWNAWKTVVTSSNIGTYAITALSDTLATVTGRGATTSTLVRINNQLQVGQNTNGTAWIDAYGGFAYYGADSNSTGMKINSAGTASFTGSISASNFSGSSSGTNTGDNPGVTSVAGVTPIVSSGGTTPSISHATSGVGAGTYNNVTVNTFGHVTAGSNVGYVSSSGVTSVATAGTVSGLTLTGGTITTTGTITLGGTLSVLPSNFASQSATTVLASPTLAAGVPTFRTLTLEDIPDAWVKKSVRAATTANITLSAVQTVDGIVLVAGDRVLVKDQTATATNGIYVVAAAAWTRALDADTVSKIAGAHVNVDSGTVNGGLSFDNDLKTTDTLGTTTVPWYTIVDSGYTGTLKGSSFTLSSTTAGSVFNVNCLSANNERVVRVGSTLRFWEIIGATQTEFYSYGTNNSRVRFLPNGVATLTIDTTGTAATGTLSATGAITQNGSQVLHAGNYTSYSPSLTGGSASGTWGINVTGTAASETLATVTGRGASTATASSFTGGVQGTTVAAQGYGVRVVAGTTDTPAILQFTNNAVNVEWSNLSATNGLITASAAMKVTGTLTVSSNNTTGGGIILADDGDIVDLNDAYCSMRFSSGVRIYSGNRTGSVAITLGSNGTIVATNNITAYSDIKLKENITTIDSALDKTLKLRGVYYTRKDKEDKTRKVGVIAQEIQEVLPEVVKLDDSDTLSVDYGNITALLIEAIKEQQTIIDSQESRIARLENLVFKLTEGK